MPCSLRFCKITLMQRKKSVRVFRIFLFKDLSLWGMANKKRYVVYTSKDWMDQRWTFHFSSATTRHPGKTKDIILMPTPDPFYYKGKGFVQVIHWFQSVFQLLTKRILWALNEMIIQQKKERFLIDFQFLICSDHQ